MAFTSGNDFRLHINSGTTGTPVWSEAQCEGTCSISVSSNVADTTGKCSSNWTTGEISHSSWTVSADGHYTASDTGVDEWRDKILSQTSVMVQVKTHGGEVYSGTVNPTSLDITSAFDGVVDFSLSGDGTGALSVA